MLFFIAVFFFFLFQIDLLKGYDILVCTPKRLLRLLDNEVAFDFKRLSHIVFDDMDTLINSFDAEVSMRS